MWVHGNATEHMYEDGLLQEMAQHIQILIFVLKKL